MLRVKMVIEIKEHLLLLLNIFKNFFYNLIKLSLTLVSIVKNL